MYRIFNLFCKAGRYLLTYNLMEKRILWCRLYFRYHTYQKYVQRNTYRDYYIKFLILLFFPSLSEKFIYFYALFIARHVAKGQRKLTHVTNIVTTNLLVEFCYVSTAFSTTAFPRIAAIVSTSPHGQERTNNISG